MAQEPTAGLIQREKHHVGPDIITRPDDGQWIMLLITLVAIGGAIGGCAGAAHVFLAKNQNIRAIQFAAYIILGTAFGLMSFIILSVAAGYFDMDIKLTVTEMFGVAIAFGMFGSLMLASVNLTISWSLKHLKGIEVQLTTNKDSEKTNDRAAGRRDDG